MSEPVKHWSDCAIHNEPSLECDCKKPYTPCLACARFENDCDVTNGWCGKADTCERYIPHNQWLRVISTPTPEHTAEEVIDVPEHVLCADCEAQLPWRIRNGNFEVMKCPCGHKPVSEEEHTAEWYLERLPDYITEKDRLLYMRIERLPDDTGKRITVTGYFYKSEIVDLKHFCNGKDDTKALKKLYGWCVAEGHCPKEE